MSRMDNEIGTKVYSTWGLLTRTWERQILTTLCNTAISKDMDLKFGKLLIVFTKL